MVERKSVQIHTRKLDRLVAHTNMKNRGIQHVNRHSYYGSNEWEKAVEPSYFARKWRKFREYVPTVDLRR